MAIEVGPPPLDGRTAPARGRHAGLVAVLALVVVAVGIAVASHGTRAAVRTWPFGTPLDTLVVVDGALWAGQSQDEAVLRLDPATGAIASRLGVGERVGAGGGHVWTLDHQGQWLTELDARTGGVLRSVALEQPDGNPYKGFDAFPNGDAVWVAGAAGAAVFDRRTLAPRRVVKRPGDAVQPASWSSAGDAVWLLRQDGRIERYDGSTGRRTRQLPPVGDGRPEQIAAVRDRVVVRTAGGTVAALDPDSGTVQWTTRLPGAASAMTLTSDRVILQQPKPGAPHDQLVALDARDGRPAGTADVPALGATALAVRDATIFSAAPGGQLAAVPMPG